MRSNSLTWLGFQARLPELGRRIADKGLYEVELRLSHYIASANRRQ
jgi:hypothetical protein